MVASNLLAIEILDIYNDSHKDPLLFLPKPYLPKLLPVNLFIIVRDMSEKDTKEKQGDVGPSLVLGLIGAVFVLILLAGAVWGVGKIISKIRESGDDQNEETVAEEQDQEEQADDSTSGDEENAEGETTDESTTSQEEGTNDTAEQETAEQETEEQETEEQETAEQETEGDIDGDGASDQGEQQEGSDDSTKTEDQTGETTGGGAVGRWVANNYKYGDIEGSSYTVVRGDTLWEIAEARYGSGFEWHKIQDANFDAIRYLPNGSKALIVPGQVLTLP